MQSAGKVCWGNAVEDRDHKQWLFGHFAALGSLLHQKNVKSKIGTHKKGEGRKREDATADPEFWTISLLISGKQRFIFPRNVENGGDKEFILENLFDYALWAPGVKHSWEAMEDLQVLTFCWKEEFSAKS